MTLAQKIIMAYLRGHAPEQMQDMSTIDCDKVRITYKSGQSETYSCNLYGDILRLHQGNWELVARVDGVHDLEITDPEIPTGWVDM